MKKTFLLVITLFTVFIANAQLDQGTISLGGVLNYSSNTHKNQSGSTSSSSSLNTLIFGPRIGYFVSDGVSLGTALIFISSRRPDMNWNGSPVTIKSHTLAFSPYARFHKSVGESFYFFVEGMFSFGAGGSKTITGDNINKGDNIGIFGVYVSPGILFMPSEKFGIELSFTGLQFERITYKHPEHTENRNINYDFKIGPDTFTPQIGVQYYF